MPTTPAAFFARRTYSLVAISAGLFAATLPGRAALKDIDDFYAPLRVEQAALSPDGRHVAFTVRGPKGLEVQIFDTERPGEKASIPLDRERKAAPRVLRWISADQLLAVSNSPQVVLSDAAGRSPRLVDLTNLLRLTAGVEDDAKRPETRIIPEPDDPAVLLFENNVKVPPDDAPAAPAPAAADNAESEESTTAAATPSGSGGGNGGIPGRPRILELHRFNVLTGEVKRLMDYDVELAQVGATIIDHTGNPRIVFRYGAEPPHFAYRDSRTKATLLNIVFGDSGWVSLGDLLHDAASYSFLLEPKNILQERTIPLGFDADPNVLLFASNLHRDTYGIYAADLSSGKKTELSVEEPGFDLVDPETPWKDPPLVFDPHTHALVGVKVRKTEPAVRWFDAEITTVQKELEKKFPGRRIQLLDWDESRQRVLALIDSLADPGRYFVYQRSDGRCVEYLRRVANLTSNELNPVSSFAFTTPEGVSLNGYVTLPRDPGKVPPPLVVFFHDGPWQRIEAGFDRDAQALATLGMAVLKLNYRGSSGFGVAHREAIRANLDRVPLADALAAIDWVKAHHRVDSRRVGLIGEGYGGYLALRGLQLHPEMFLSAVVINGLTTPLDLWSSLEPPPGPMNLSGRAQFKRPGQRSGPPPDRALALWLVSKQSGLGSIAVTSNLKTLTQPVFLIHDPDNPAAPYDAISRLRSSLRRQGQSPEFQELSAEFARPDSSERSRVYRRIGEFFTLTLNEFKVRVGEAREKKEEP